MHVQVEVCCESVFRVWKKVLGFGMSSDDDMLSAFEGFVWQMLVTCMYAVM